MLTRTQALEGGANVACISKVHKSHLVQINYFAINKHNQIINTSRKDDTLSNKFSNLSPCMQTDKGS